MFCWMQMFDSMWQMASLVGCWYSLSQLARVLWNLGNLWLILTWIPIRKGGGTLGSLPFTVGIGTKHPGFWVTYWSGIKLCTFWFHPLWAIVLLYVFIWIQLELLSCFDIKNSNSNMPNRKSHKSKKKTPKQEFPAGYIESRPWAVQGHESMPHAK